MQRLFPLVICWVIFRHAQTIGYVIVQKPDPFRQNSIIRTAWNRQKFWTMNTQNLSTLQVFQSFSNKCKSLFLQSCPNELIWFLCECKINLPKGNLQSIKRHHVANFQSEVRLLSPTGTTWKQRRDILASERGLQLIKVITLPIINHLSWLGAICSRPWFCVQQQQDFEYSGSNKAGASEVSGWTNSTYEITLLKKNEQKVVLQSRRFSRQNFVFSVYQALKIADFSVGWCRNWRFTVTLCSTTSSQNRRRSRHLLHFIDAAGISPPLVLNQNAKAKERGTWVPFKKRTSEAAKAVHARRCFLWVCTQFT